MENNSTTTNSRKASALLLLPLLVIPFLTLGFWALGGGRHNTSKTTTPSGLNLELPDAALKNKTAENKLYFYEQAEQDAARLATQRKKDSLYGMAFVPDTTNPLETHLTGKYDPAPPFYPVSGDVQEEQVYRKLAALNQQLEQSTSVPASPPGEVAISSHTNEKEAIRDHTAIEILQSEASQKGQKSQRDPELEQLDRMMDKVLDIQHAGRRSEQTKGRPEVADVKVFAVTQPTPADSITLLTGTSLRPDTSIEIPVTEGKFYSLPRNDDPLPTANSIEAVVDHTQTLVSGATIKLRLCHALNIDKVLVPKGQVLYGLTALTGERLQVHIPSIRNENRILPVDLSVYDLDGLEGIFVPGTITRDAARQASENWVQGMDLLPDNHSLASQAATAGVQAAKTLFNKRARLVPVTVKAGYRVLLQDNKQQNSLSY